MQILISYMGVFILSQLVMEHQKTPTCMSETTAEVEPADSLVLFETQLIAV